MNKLNKKYRISKFSFLSKKDGFVIIYNSLNVKKIYGKKYLLETFLSFKKLSSPAYVINKISSRYHLHKDRVRLLIKTLTRLGFIVENSSDEKRMFNEIKKTIPKKFQLRTLFFSVTDKCNFRCKYCIVRENFPEKIQLKDMSIKLAQKTIDYFFLNRHKKEKTQIVFFGGEPLLNLPVIKFSIPYIREKEKKSKYKPSRIFFMTNGSLVNESIAKFFKKNGVLPIISLDGPRDIHDNMRISSCGGTFNRVMKGYKILKKTGCEVSVCITVNMHNFKILPKVVEYVATELKPCSSSTNLPHRPLNVKNEKYFDAIDSLAAIKLIEAFKISRQYGLYITKHIMDNRVRPFVEEIPKIKFCGGAGSRIMIDPDGRMSPCETFAGMRKKYKNNVLKNPDIKYIFDKDLISHSVFNIKKCYYCKAISVCGGFCPYKTKIITGSINTPDKSTCKQSATFLNFLLFDLLKILKQTGKFKNIDSKIFVIPQKEDLLKIYGNINVKNGDKFAYF